MKNKTILISILFLLSLLLIIPIVKAQDVSDTLNGLNKTANEVKAFKDSTSVTNYSNFLQTKTGQIIGIVLSFIGVLFLILMIYAGISWMTANGNQEKVNKAKDLMINAIIGIIIIFAAYAITKFVGDQILK